jgi:hypothetical protein
LSVALVVAAFAIGWHTRRTGFTDRVIGSAQPIEHSLPKLRSSSCGSCGTNRPRTLGDPIMPRRTILVREYLARVQEIGPLDVDVEEIKAIVVHDAHADPDPDSEDAAIFALRAGASWLDEPIENAVATDLVEILYDACEDPRPRVRECARLLMNALDGEV